MFCVVFNKFNFFAFGNFGFRTGLEDFAVFIDDNTVRICCKECGFVGLVFVCTACDSVQESIRFELHLGVEFFVFGNIRTQFGRKIFCHKSPSGSVNFICGVCRTITLLEPSIQ